MNYYMIWFTGIVVGSFAIAFFSRMMPMHRPNPLGEPQPNPIGFLIPALAFGIFSGLRINMGDTESYVLSYHLMDLDTMDPVTFKIQGNIMYNLIQYWCRLRNPEPYELIMITALIFVLPTVLIIYRYSSPYELGIAMFVLTGFYTFSMNGIRQYAAAGVLILGTKYLLSDKKTDFFKYLIFVIGAWMFHTSALVMIVVYFVVRRRAWSSLTVAMLAGTVFVTMIFNAILPTFLSLLEDTDYSIYAENGWFTEGTETGSNIIRIAVLVVPLVLAYVERFQMSAVYGRKWDILVNLSLINLMFYILSLYNWIFARLAIYTSVYVIIMMTHVIAYGENPEKARWLYPASLVMYSFYFYNVRYSIESYASDLF